MRTGYIDLEIVTEFLIVVLECFVALIVVVFYSLRNAVELVVFLIAAVLYKAKKTLCGKN